MTHKLPALPYSYSALEPYIDTRTMAVHYNMHHRGYVNNLNKALAGYEDLQDKSVVELLHNLDAVPEEIRGAVRNNGGGHLNHSIFWTCLTPNVGGAAPDNLFTFINDSFGSLDAFKAEFAKAAATRFGSGWAWLCVDEEMKGVVMATPYQDNPISQGMVPILGLDVWEHAYYLNYQNRRTDYIAAFWNVVNWKSVNASLQSVQAAAAAQKLTEKVQSKWDDLVTGLNSLIGGDDNPEENPE
jgi:Fe-Mn family superoxide dismutase